MADKKSKNRGKETREQSNGKAQAAEGASGALPLFYQNPVPLDAKKHAKLGLKKNFGFGFTQNINAVPINLIEMPQICHFYPIAFTMDNNATPVAILGLRDNENLFLRPDNSWEDSYIPAYIRRYPFIFSELPDSDQLTLCVDFDDNLIEEGGEQAFFDKDGKPSEFSQKALEFCKSYHAAAQQTIEFSKSLVENGLLIERSAKINVGDNKSINFSGFRIIDEQKLQALDEKVFLDWRQKGWLPHIYAHLFSGYAWNRLSQLLGQRLEKEAA